MHTETSSASSAGILEDIFRLIPAHERAAFHEMLQHELRGRELADDELRHVAERTWHDFLRYGSQSTVMDSGSFSRKSPFLW